MDITDLLRCPVCIEDFDYDVPRFSSNEEKRSSRLPTLSAKCCHKICANCLNNWQLVAMSEQTSAKAKIPKWFKCHTCKKKTAFNAVDIKIDLYACGAIASLKSSGSTASEPRPRARSLKNELEYCEGTVDDGASAEHFFEKETARRTMPRFEAAVVTKSEVGYDTTQESPTSPGTPSVSSRRDRKRKFLETALEERESGGHLGNSTVCCEEMLSVKKFLESSASRHTAIAKSSSLCNYRVQIYGLKNCKVIDVDHTLCPAEMLALGKEEERRVLEMRAGVIQKERTMGRYVLPEAPDGKDCCEVPGNFLFLFSQDEIGYHFYQMEGDAARKDIPRTFDLIERNAIDPLQAEREAKSAVENTSGSKSRVVEKTFGYYSNGHCEPMETNSMSHWRNVVKSLVDYPLPNRLKRLKVQSMAGNSIAGHTDTFSGATLNMLISHDVGGSLMVRPWPEFKTSVVILDGEECIPVDFDISRDMLCMVGLDGRKGSDGKAVYHVFHASELRRLEPVGTLKYAVAGIADDGKVLVAPFLQEKRTDEMIRDIHDLEKQRLRYLFNNARKRPYKDGFVEKQKATAYRLGREPHKWYFFFAWRCIHWWEGDPSVRRTQGSLPFIEEGASGGSRITACHYVDHRKRGSELSNTGPRE